MGPDQRELRIRLQLWPGKEPGLPEHYEEQRYESGESEHRWKHLSDTLFVWVIASREKPTRAGLCGAGMSEIIGA
jgi:hypothetical protein